MNPDKTKTQFTIAEAIVIQLEGLTMWSCVLTTEAFVRLFREVIKDNDKARSGYDVCRGDDIENIVRKIARSI